MGRRAWRTSNACRTRREETGTGALPVHLVARDGLEAAGLAPSTIAWAGANGFSGEAGRTLACPAKTARLPAPCSASATARARWPSARWREPCRKATGISPRRRPSRNSRQSRWCSAAMSSPATARSQARRCASTLPAGADAGACSPHRRWRLPDARPGQHADQRHGAGRAGEGGADPGRSAQGRSLGDQGRRSARRRTSR